MIIDWNNISKCLDFLNIYQYCYLLLCHIKIYTILNWCVLWFYVKKKKTKDRRERSRKCENQMTFPENKWLMTLKGTEIILQPKPRGTVWINEMNTCLKPLPLTFNCTAALLKKLWWTNIVISDKWHLWTFKKKPKTHTQKPNKKNFSAEQVLVYWKSVL